MKTKKRATSERISVKLTTDDESATYQINFNRCSLTTQLVCNSRPNFDPKKAQYECNMAVQRMSHLRGLTYGEVADRLVACGMVSHDLREFARSVEAETDHFNNAPAHVIQPEEIIKAAQTNRDDLEQLTKKGLIAAFRSWGETQGMKPIDLEQYRCSKLTRPQLVALIQDKLEK